MRFDDYLTRGRRRSRARGARILRRAKVHAGRLLHRRHAALDLHGLGQHALRRATRVPVAHWTLLTTLIDFSQSRATSRCSSTRACIGWLAESMAQARLSRRQRDGDHLPPAALEQPDLALRGARLAATASAAAVRRAVLEHGHHAHAAAAMHEFYLREMYLNNNLIKPDALTIAGEPIDLDRIVQPLYAVTAEDDHIAPWRQTFRINN